jgi:hypothetical protein
VAPYPPRTAEIVIKAARTNHVPAALEISLAPFMMAGGDGRPVAVGQAGHPLEGTGRCTRSGYGADLRNPAAIRQAGPAPAVIVMPIDP